MGLGGSCRAKMLDKLSFVINIAQPARPGVNIVQVLTELLGCASACLCLQHEMAFSAVGMADGTLAEPGRLCLVPLGIFEVLDNTC